MPKILRYYGIVVPRSGELGAGGERAAHARNSGVMNPPTFTGAMRSDGRLNAAFVDRETFLLGVGDGSGGGGGRGAARTVLSVCF